MSLLRSRRSDPSGPPPGAAARRVALRAGSWILCVVSSWGVGFASGSVAGEPPGAPEEEPRRPAPEAIVAGDPARLVDTFVGLRDAPMETIWPRVAELIALRRAEEDPEISEVVTRLTTLEERSRLAAARFLLDCAGPAAGKLAQLALLQLAREASDREVRLASIRLLREPLRAMRPAAYLALQDIVKAAKDPRIVVEALLSSWHLENDPATRKPLIAMLDSTDTGERYLAALALVETGWTEKPVPSILESLQSEPSERGLRAALFLELLAARRDARDGGGREGPKTAPVGDAARTAAGVGEPRTDGGSSADWGAAIQEVMAEILRSSMYGKLLGVRELHVAALKGMASALDDYSAFLDVDDVRDLEAAELGTRLGLGARILQPDPSGPLVIAAVQPGAPAAAAGLRAGDRVFEVDGVPTAGTPIEQLRSLSAARDEGPVHLLTASWNESIPRLVTVQRREIDVPSVSAEHLPTGIGYLRVLRFGPGTSAEADRLLDGLESRGLTSLIIDLRDDPGGRLEEAVKLVDQFVGEKSRPIVTESGPGGEREYFPDAAERPYCPIFVLVNAATASSAEVVAAALQDFGRATILGQRTFGKGVKQTLIPLSPRFRQLLGGEGKLLLSTSLLYSPLGRPLHARSSSRGPGAPRDGGVTPDIPVESMPGAAGGDGGGREPTRVQYSRAVADFIRGHEARARAALETWDPAAERDFPDLVSGLSTRLSREEVRLAVVRAARKYLRSEGEQTLEARLRDDPELARAVREAIERTARAPMAAPTGANAPAEDPNVVGGGS